jgi:putative hydrolase of HD superfamily
VELAAADRLFGLLPAAQGAELRALWDEFEAKDTPEARFAAAVDRLQPLLLNLLAGGRTWSEHHITDDRVRAVNSVIGLASPRLWDVASALLDGAVARGDLAPGP